MKKNQDALPFVNTLTREQSATGKKGAAAGMSGKLSALGILLGLLVCLTESTLAAIVSNGGLETLPGDTFQTVLPGNSYSGWNSVGGGDVEFTTTQTLVLGGYFGPVAEGLGCVDLNGVSYQGAIAQVLTTQPGQAYYLRFAMSGNPGILGQPRRATKTMDVSWGGTNVGSLAFAHLASDTQTNMRWEDHEIVVIGSGRDELRFTSTTGTYSDAGPVIDDISVVPLPDTLLTIRCSQVEFCWNTLTNFSYQIEYRSLITTNSWAPFGGPFQGTGGMICTNDTIQAGQPQRFYRAVRKP